MSIEDDPFLQRFFGSAEQRAKWIYRFRIMYVFWIIFVILGVLFIMLFYMLRF